MKKTFIFLSLSALLAACDSGYKPDGADKQSAATAAAVSGDSTAGANVAAVAQQPQTDTSNSKIGTEHTGGAVAKGAQLLTASDCASCHKEKEKLVGPAYTAVAQKYPATDANVAMLAHKIIAGGKGHWGEVPMTPHPTLALADAKEMTKYILSLK